MCSFFRCKILNSIKAGKFTPTAAEVNGIKQCRIIDLCVVILFLSVDIKEFKIDEIRFKVEYDARTVSFPV